MLGDCNPKPIIKGKRRIATVVSDIVKLSSRDLVVKISPGHTTIEAYNMYSRLPIRVKPGKKSATTFLKMTKTK